MNFNEILKGGNIYMKDDIVEYYMNTGSTMLDVLIGGGEGFGWPVGTFTNIVGDSSSGKTALAMEALAAGFHSQNKMREKHPELQRFRFHYDGAEVGNTFKTDELYGFDINSDPFLVKDENGDMVKPRTKKVERLAHNLKKFLASMEEGDYGLYILDSLDGIINDEVEKRQEERSKAYEAGKEFKEGSYDMRTQKFLSQEFFPTYVDQIKKKNVHFIIISQVRDKIGAMFQTQTRKGGKALGFYCSTEIWLHHMSYIKKKERPIGIVVKAKTKKTRHPRPARSVLFTFLNTFGLDDVGDCIDYLYDLRGERGDLLSKANSINLGEEPTFTKLKEFLDTTELTEVFKEQHKKNGGKGIGTKTDIITFLQKPKYKKLYESRFADKINREDLIQKIIAEHREEEFSKKAIEKWESIEKSIIPNRGGRKYG